MKNNINQNFQPNFLLKNSSQASLNTIGFQENYAINKHGKQNSYSKSRYSKASLNFKQNYESTKQSYNSLLNSRPPWSRTSAVSKQTTPQFDNPVKNSNHFAKILNKFQNIFKKEESEVSQGRTLKSSQSKQNLNYDRNKFILKKFKESVMPTRNNLQNNTSK